MSLQYVPGSPRSIMQMCEAGLRVTSTPSTCCMVAWCHNVRNLVTCSGISGLLEKSCKRACSPSTPNHSLICQHLDANTLIESLGMQHAHSRYLVNTNNNSALNSLNCETFSDGNSITSNTSLTWMAPLFSAELPESSC